MKNYRPKITLSTFIWLFAIIALLIYQYFENTSRGLFYGALFSTLLLGFVWYIIFIFPTYSIIDNSLKLNIFLEKKTIPIPSIRKVERNQIRGIYPFLNPYRKGLLIHFNSYDDVFINPSSEDSFIEELLKVNPNVEIIS